MSILGGVLNKIVGGKSGKIVLQGLIDLGSESMTAPLCQDIDGDGEQEIICSTIKGEIFVLDENLKLKWKYISAPTTSEVERMFTDAQTGSSIATTPRVFDINGDGKKEILFGTENGDVFALDCKGELLWKYSTNGAVRGGINIFYVGEEKKIRIIFGNSDKKIYIFDAKGKLDSLIEIDEGIESTPIIIDGLIVFGTDKGRIQAYNLAGKMQWSTQKTGAKITSEATPFKFANGKSCFVIGSTDNSIYCFNTEGIMLWSFKTKGSIYSKIVLADVNDDGANEILFGSADNKLHVLSLDGTEIWDFESDFWIIGSPLAMDIDNDGQLEIVAGSYDNTVYFLAGDGSFVVDYVPGISGIVIQGGNYSDIPVSIPGNVIGKKIWAYLAPGIVIGCSALRNLVVVQTKEGKVLILKHEK